MTIFKEKSIGILELSSSKIKYFEGSSGKIDLIQRYKFDTKTNEGLRGKKLDPNYFKLHLYPIIEQILREHKNSKIYCIATALFREITNIQEIQDICPIKINVLSEYEEASGSIDSFLKTTHRNLKNKLIVTMDPGSMSTEVYVKDYGFISLKFGTRVNSQKSQELKKLKQKFGWLSGKQNVLIVIPGFRNEMNDKDLNIQNYPECILKDNITDILNIIGTQHQLVCSSGNLGIGYYYKIKYGNI